jgi:predicted nucleotidyltransferase component of viral defense system
LNADLTLETLLEVRKLFGLPSAALVEKDYYVTQALAAIAALDTTPLVLVFGGGTSLCRAHRLIRRMSEDIDFKITCERKPTRTELRRLRENLTQALLGAGFEFDPANPAYRKSRNESRYTIFHLPYMALFQGEGILRPEIQIETTASPLLAPAVHLPLRSFVAEAFNRPAEVAQIQCVSIIQTAAEKFVSLTRRSAAAIAGAGGPPDPALVRHIYDLHAIRPFYDPAEVAVMVQAIMRYDAEVFGNQFPAYRDNPLAETLAAITAFETDPAYGRIYEAFQRYMVYGPPVEFPLVLATLKELAGFLQR